MANIDMARGGGVSDAAGHFYARTGFSRVLVPSRLS